LNNGHPRLRLGDAEITPLVDAVGVLGDVNTLFPGVPGGDWDPYRRSYPTLFDGRGWRVPFGCFLVRIPGTTCLIDTGVGPPPGTFLPERQGWLLERLTAAAITVDEIDVCLLTHLHVDHIGWVSTADAGPTFPKARYFASHGDWEWVHGREPEERDQVIPKLVPLAQADVLELVVGETEVTHGITLLPTPGHTPGHMSVRIRSQGAEGLILGDVAVHPAQIDHPAWAYTYDVEPQLAAETRATVLRGVAGRDILVACGHYPDGGLGRLTSVAGRPWRAL
jgi:glyoxylase-like metal-dependent hydrolase (beta-lactamase superfamily II)